MMPRRGGTPKMDGLEGKIHENPINILIYDLGVPHDLGNLQLGLSIFLEQIVVLLGLPHDSWTVE